MKGGIGAPHDFPADLRGALLSYLKQTGGTGFDPIWWAFAQNEGYGSVDDYLAACERRFGDGTAAAVRARMDERWQFLLMQSPNRGNTAAAEHVKAGMRPMLALSVMPDPDFRVALEHGLRLAAQHLALHDLSFGGTDVVGDLAEHVNTLFAKRGVPYRLDRDVRLQFHGDPTVRELVVAPALAALADPRLAGARSEFEDALTKLGAGRPKDVEDAIEESRKAVESAMKVLIDARGLDRPARETTSPLIKVLVNGGVIEEQTDDLLRAAARIANGLASHGAGGQIRQVPDDLAAATVSAAATAISFLAARLP